METDIMADIVLDPQQEETNHAIVIAPMVKHECKCDIAFVLKQELSVSNHNNEELSLCLKNKKTGRNRRWKILHSACCEERT